MYLIYYHQKADQTSGYNIQLLSYHQTIGAKDNQTTMYKVTGKMLHSWVKICLVVVSVLGSSSAFTMDQGKARVATV